MTTFFFDDPNFAVVVPIPFSENGAQYNDIFRNTKATFNAGVSGGTTDATSFFFGGGNDLFFNEKGAAFNARDVTTIAMGSGLDQMLNQGQQNPVQRVRRDDHLLRQP